MGYFDSSDEESDYEDNHRKVATKKKKKPSFLDDSDSDSDDDESNIDFDDSFLGSFRKKQAKAKAALEKQKQFEQDATETTQPEEFTETAAADEQVVYRETTKDWVETLRLLRKKTSRNKRGAANVQFKEVLVTELLEYNQHEDSVRSVNDETHEAQDHNETPWYEEEYEELPWHMQPDLDEDDAITALCKKVLAADKQQQQQEPDGGEAVKDRLSFRAAAVEASVIGFALKLKSRLAVGKA